jgi:hypothetical protein
VDHVDPARAAKESRPAERSPTGSYALALVAPTSFEVLMTKLTMKQAVNYGWKRCSSSHRCAGKRVRATSRSPRSKTAAAAASC